MGVASSERALKESSSVWEAAGLEVSRCACVCQVGEVDLASRARV